MRARWLAALGFASSIATLSPSGCKPVVHPSDPSIPKQICGPRCQRVHDCDPNVDSLDCEARCECTLSPRIVFDRPDLVRQMTDCAGSSFPIPRPAS